MAKIEERFPGEYIFVDIEVSDKRPVGDWAAEGGSDGRKDAGEEGGATKGSAMESGWDGFSAVGTSDPVVGVSGTRAACPIRCLFL